MTEGYVDIQGTRCKCGCTVYKHAEDTNLCGGIKTVYPQGYDADPVEQLCDCKMFDPVECPNVPWEDN